MGSALWSTQGSLKPFTSQRTGHPQRAKASGAGSSLAAVAISSLTTAEKRARRLPLAIPASRAVTQKFLCLKKGHILLATARRGRIFRSLVCFLLVAIRKPWTRGDPRPAGAEPRGLPFGGSSTAQRRVPALLAAVLKYRSISIPSAATEKANRQRGFALGLLNFHGNLAGPAESRFPANFSSFALCPGCSARAANATAGSCSFAARSSVTEKS